MAERATPPGRGTYGAIELSAARQVSIGISPVVRDTTWPSASTKTKPGKLDMPNAAKALLFNHILEDGASAVINIDGERAVSPRRGD